MANPDQKGKILSFPGASGKNDNLTVSELKEIFLNFNQVAITKALATVMSISYERAEECSSHFCQRAEKLKVDEIDQILGITESGFNDRLELLHSYFSIQGLAAMYFLEKIAGKKS